MADTGAAKPALICPYTISIPSVDTPNKGKISGEVATTSVTSKDGGEFWEQALRITYQDKTGFFNGAPLHAYVNLTKEYTCSSPHGINTFQEMKSVPFTQVSKGVYQAVVKIGEGFSDCSEPMKEAQIGMTDGSKSDTYGFGKNVNLPLDKAASDADLNPKPPKPPAVACTLPTK
jgi:hypothetical protein